jgi:Mg-chelatase subunit ChlD
LAINQNAQSAIDFQSLHLLAALLINVMDNENGSNLADAIKVALKIKASCRAKRSYLFVLTDGFGQEGPEGNKGLERLSSGKAAAKGKMK